MFLEIISIELTHKCNLDCEWCFNKYSLGFSRKWELPYEKLVYVLLTFEKWRRKNNIKKPLIKLTWWEPLLHSKFTQIVLFIKKVLKYKIKLNTNWLLIEKYETLIKDNIDIILFSYHFLDKSTDIWDYRHKKDKAAKIISNMPKNIKKIICTRTNKDFIDNIDSIVAYINTSFSFDKYIFWFPLLAKDEILDFWKNDFEKFVKKVILLDSKYKIDLKIGFPPAFCFNKKPYLLDLVTEIENLYTFLWIRININPFWRLTNSYYYTEEEIEVKNEESFDLFFNSKLLKKTKGFEWVNKTCKECRFLNKCWWGNRMFAYASNWDLFWKDPWMT